MKLKLQQETLLDYLQVESDLFVNLHTNIFQEKEFIFVDTTHTLNGEKLLNKYLSKWAFDNPPNTEYGNGLSTFHDIKDHFLYGLDTTILTEFQTIVQTYYGRSFFVKDYDYEQVIHSAIKDEVLGPRGPRVYGSNQLGLIDLHYKDASKEGKERIFDCITFICFEIMFPFLQDLYSKNETLLALQDRTVKLPIILDHYLNGIRWKNKETRFFTLNDNIGYEHNIKAYINEYAVEYSIEIRNCIDDFIEKQGLNEEFPLIFTTQKYILGE